LNTYAILKEEDPSDEAVVRRQINQIAVGSVSGLRTRTKLDAGIGGRVGLGVAGIDANTAYDRLYSVHRYRRNWNVRISKLAERESLTSKSNAQYHLTPRNSVFGDLFVYFRH
jgi:hypothetical protein